MSSWQKFLAIVGVVIVANFIVLNSGLVGSLVVLGLMLSLWWLSYALKERTMDKLYLQLREMDDQKRREVMAGLDPDTVADIYKRMNTDSPPIDPPK